MTDSASASLSKAVVLALAASSCLLLAAAAVAGQADKEILARGKYLVERVAMCGDCHTPHGRDGAPDQGHFLQGALLPFGPPNDPHFSHCAPSIAGLLFWPDDDAVKFLERGLNLGDRPAEPPMPDYRLSHEDAAAVTAYLKSLPPPPSSYAPCASAEADHQPKPSRR